MDCIAYFSGSVTITDHIGFNVPGHLKYLLQDVYKRQGWKMPDTTHRYPGTGTVTAT